MMHENVSSKSEWPQPTGPVDAEASRGRVLVVDDDALFCESVSRNLMHAGYAIHGVSNGPAAISHVTDEPDTDLVLLDWKMPGMTGIEVLQKLRAEKIDIPVIFLTALTDQIYEEAGLLGGAVDFVDKSRNFSILIKRIELILSGRKLREDAANRPVVAYHGDLALSYESSRATWKRTPLDLTLTEFQIVAHLAQNAGRDVSYREIYDIVHGDGFVAGNGEVGYRTNVRAFIKRIRQKFRQADGNFSGITNYPGFGYRWHHGGGQQ